MLGEERRDQRSSRETCLGVFEPRVHENGEGVGVDVEGRVAQPLDDDGILLVRHGGDLNSTCFS